jgi:formylglycine-generating enzyme required for sulfatase activity
MKLVKFYLKPISLFVMVTFTVLLCFWANQTPAASAAPAAEKNSETNLEKGDSNSPDFFEQEREDETVIKKNKKFPWLIVSLGTVAVGVAIYFLVIKKLKYTLTVTMGAGISGMPAATSKYKKGEVVAYNYTLQTGYDSLQVKIDDIVVPNSGIITMNSNHILSVSTTKIYSNGVLTINGVRYEMASIPAGEFQMGSNSSVANDDEKPVHTVRISKGFWLGRTEVTQGLWQVVMGSNPSYFLKGSTYPVERVSWDDCQAFITKLNQMVGSNYFRLPTEAEWEYACRAGTTGDYYGNVDSIAWYDGNSGSTTHPVAQKQANAFGLYDMSGNVWEKCQDWFGDYSGGYQTDPTGPVSGSFRVGRGGSWEFWARGVRSAIRGISVPGNRSNQTGFRLASGSVGG